MKLAFSGKARYANFKKGYELYLKRSKSGNEIDKETYNRVVRAYCKLLAETLEKYGIVDLPGDFGSIAAAYITKRPQFRGDRFIGYGAMNWKTGQYDGKLKVFGMVFLPRHVKNGNMRCFGYVANRQLFRRMKNIFNSFDCPWDAIEFKNEMI